MTETMNTTMKLDRERIYYWIKWSWAILLVPLLAACLHSLPQYRYQASELAAVALCGVTALIFSLRVMKVDFLYITFDGCVLIFLLTQTQNFHIVVLMFLFNSFCVELDKLIRYKKRNYESALYYTAMPAVSVYIACNLAAILPLPDIRYQGAAGMGVLNAVAAGYLVLLVSLWFEYLGVYILRKRSYFLKLSSYGTPMLMQTFDSAVTLVLINTYPFMGNVGLAMAFALMLVLLYFSYIYYEQTSKHGALENTIGALSRSMELGGFNERAEEMIKELAGILKGCDCVLYRFDNGTGKQLPMIAAYHTMDECTIMEPEDYRIDIRKNEDLLARLGSTAGSLYEERTLSMAGLKGVGKSLKSAKGFVATPIVGVSGVEGMLLVLSEMIYLNNKQMQSIVSVVGKQLSIKLVNDTLYNRVEEHASRDGLTGLYNRRIFDKVIHKYIEEDKPFSIALFDIDKFKDVNDVYGHSVGDLVLQRVSDILKMNSKGVDYACRYGGEELCIIFDRLDAEVAFTVAERIREAVENIEIAGFNSYENSAGKGSKGNFRNKPVKVTVSGGVASYPANGRSAREIIDAADRVLYAECKQKGRNRVAGA